MTIDGLIVRLMELQEKHGNLQVAVRNAEFCCAEPIDHVSVETSNRSTYKGHYGRDKEELGEQFVELHTW